MVPTVENLLLIAGSTKGRGNAVAIVASLTKFGTQFGLDQRHRVAHFIAQIMHESGGLIYDQEIASGKAYEGRKDLGNTHAGDGVKFKGRTELQVTGRANYAAFRDWCRKMGFDCPDFEANPEAINTDPWEGLAAIWFWSTRNLNRYADENNLEQITRKINGGLNGFADRVRMFTRTSLVLLGYAPDDLKAFQHVAQKNGLLPADTPTVKQVDGEDGPLTRTALFKSLSEFSTVETKDAPVVQVVEKEVPVDRPVEVPVVAKGSDKRGWLWWSGGGLGGLGLFQSFTDLPPLYKLGVGVGILALLVILLFLGDRIIRRVKTLRDAIETN
jgi:putative chitinase